MTAVVFLLSLLALIALGLVPFCWAWELFFVQW